jgi:predicted porin
LEKLEMKKTLVALAALAAVGAASAQSTVTLYGRLDASVGKNTLKPNAGYTATTGQTVQDPGLNVNGSNMSGNRWGMMGTEDLGGGMKAKFQLESGFNIDNGTSAQGGALFGRHSWVGVAGGFGEVRLGRQTTIAADGPWAVTGGYANYDAWSRSSATAFGNSGSVAADGVRTNNTLKYLTPTMGGFTGTFVWSPGEDGTAATSASRYWSLGAGFVNGPINVQFAYESMNPANVTTKAWALAGAYDLGVARLSASVQRASRLTVDDKGYALGVGVPLGPMSLDLEYASEKTDGGTKASALNIRGVYNLSKRTNVYVFFTDGSAKTAVAGDKSDLSRFQVGMRHVF